MRTRKWIERLPKIELHRHLEGSLRLSSLVEIARRYDLPFPHDITALRRYVQVTSLERTHLGYLQKFSVLRQFYRTPAIIRRFAYEVVEDAARDNVRYMELRFTPRALAAAAGFRMEEVAQWVGKAVQEAANDHNIRVNLILSINRHESLRIGERIAQIAFDHPELHIVGFDLSGNEASFPGQVFTPIFLEAWRAGFGITVHAGEWGGSRNVRDAIINFKAARIGHGVKILENSDVVRIARERDVCFEVCIISNAHSGVVGAISLHPLPEMYGLGLRTTFNTDNPLLSSTSLTREYLSAMRYLNFSCEDIRCHLMNAAESAFLPTEEKAGLIADFQAELDAKGDIGATNQEGA